MWSLGKGRLYKKREALETNHKDAMRDARQSLRSRANHYGRKAVDSLEGDRSAVGSTGIWSTTWEAYRRHWCQVSI